MKKVFVVSKTHLDLGFTDYAESIRSKYIYEFIPSAAALAKTVNKNGKKAFVWTTGSWILKEALQNGTPTQREELINAIKCGNIVPHAMPFTTHTELLDGDTLDYGLSIVDEIDEIRGRKTVAAKMTDVPGHTKALVPFLAKHGIKLLHIGVNGASALPEVPECFLWKNGESEVVVIYSGDYGGAFKCDLIDEVLYFDHTLDNHGAPPPEKVLDKLSSIQKQFPGYKVEAGCLDDFADIIWQVRDKLPVLESEIGDTWIHGSATDPYKSAALRQLMSLKKQWLADGTMKKGSEEYKGFTDNLLCVAEHTCGMDSKMYFSDYKNYLKPDFQKARRADKVGIFSTGGGLFQSIMTLTNRISGNYRQGSYKAMEKSWAEQRAYISKAVSCLSESHKAQAENELASLVPKRPVAVKDDGNPFEAVTCGKWSFRLNKNGGIGCLSCDGNAVIRENDLPIAEYHCYTDSDYDYWLNHYSRNLSQTKGWAIADFARPGLKRVRGKYPAGRFAYKLEKAGLQIGGENEICITANLKCDDALCSKAGAPRLIQIIYTLSENGLNIDLSWFDKDASRLTEALFMRLYPVGDSIGITKIGSSVNPYDVASMGGRNLHAVQKYTVNCKNKCYDFINRHAPLISVGRGKVLEFDNKLEDFKKDGIAYVLHNNVWGTNFPLWYEENARFSFTITENSCE